MSSMLRKHRRNPGHAMGRSTYGNVGHGAVPSNYLQPHRNPGYAYGAEAMQVNAASAGRQTCPTNAMGAGGHTTFYNLPGNAGIPGCGTGTVAGSECGLQILPYRSETVAPGNLATLRIAALRAGAFKPRAWYMFGIGSGAANSATNVRFEITELTVQGIPQFISTSANVPAAGAQGNVCLSDSFITSDEPVPVSFMVFGTDQGQTLDMTVRNLGNINADLYVTFWGDAAEVSAVGTY